MGWDFVLMFCLAFTFFWALSRILETTIVKILKKRYARIHFKLTERYRRGL